MSTPRERIEADLKAAMKQRDTARLSTLRLLLTAVKNRGIELKGDVDDDEFTAIVRKQIKQRQDSIQQYREGGRDELAAKEEAEIGLLEAYMPEQIGGRDRCRRCGPGRRRGARGSQGDGPGDESDDGQVRSFRRRQCHFQGRQRDPARLIRLPTPPSF